MKAFTTIIYLFILLFVVSAVEAVNLCCRVFCGRRLIKLFDYDDTID